MAPVSRGSAVKDRPNGLLPGPPGASELPPSTMAAQLINNLSTTSKPSRQSGQDDLKALMELSRVANEAEEFSSLEAKLEHHHKLIYVFARLVLEPLTTDDPFLDVQNVVSQASDALDAFIIAIKETPSVLQFVSQPGSFQSRGQEPLWIWLFPRLLALLGRGRCNSLTEQIKDLFFVSFQAVSRSPELWNMASLFFCYLKECATTVLEHLQSPRITSPGYELSILLHFDGVDLSTRYSDHGESQRSTVPSVYILQDAATGLWHVTNVLSMLVDISMESAISHHAAPAFQDYLAWLLESFFVAYEFQKRWYANLAFQESCRKSKVMAFCAIQALLSTLQESLSDSILRKGCVLLSFLSADLLADPTDLPDRSIAQSLCSGLLILAAVCKRHNTARQVVSLHLAPAISAILCNDDATFKLGKDFQKAWATLCQTSELEQPPIAELNPSESFDNIRLEGEFRSLGLGPLGNRLVSQAPPSKRRKLHSEPSLLLDIIAEFCSLLTLDNVGGLAGLSENVEAAFATLSQKDRSSALRYLAMIPCAERGTLVVTRDQGNTIQYSKCDVCENIPPPETLPLVDETSQNMSRDAIPIFSMLVASQALQESPRLRVLGMVAVQRFAVHSTDPSFLDLDVSPLGQWSLTSLKSSIRELRILAGRTLPHFLDGPGIGPDLAVKNRFNAIQLLHKLSEKDEIHLQESFVLAWGQVGRIVQDQELNVVLLKLLDYLGHTNPVVSGVSFNEILKLAKIYGVSAEQLFSPFWDTIAVNTVKDLLVRPQTSQLMSDLLEISVPEFLILTQSHTLPWLVMHKKTDIIKRIAQARGNDGGLDVCVETSNLVPILAKLLQQNVPDTGKYIMQLLKAASPEFRDFEVTDLMRIEPASIALHLLKAAGEADDEQKEGIRNGILFLAKSAPAIDFAQKKSNAVGAFLEHHILGLVARLAEVVNDAREEKSIREKKTCIKAIEEMVKLGKTSTRAARPHICACIQSAMIHKGLQPIAFSAWETMLMNLDNEDVELMLESTFSIIHQYWKDFGDVTRHRVKSTLQYLLEQRAPLIRNTITSLPSLSQFAQLEEVEEQLNKLRTPTDVGNSFRIFSRRVSHENSGVVAHALVELKAFLREHQAFLQTSAVSEQPDVVIGILVRSILDACVKFNESHHDITILSAECIGLIGCLDPNRVESIRERREMVVVSNFVDPGETTDFVLFMLEEVIVKAFLSSTDTGVQGFLSYVMQVLLEKCDFRDVCVPILRNGQRGSASPIWRKWKSLPDSIQDTLTPFLTSRYVVKELAKVDIEYPIFRPDSTRTDRLYNTWLKDFVMDLVQQPQNIHAELIFAPLRRAIKIRDNSVASFLLPYLVLHVVLAGTDEQKQRIGEELRRIMQYQITAESHVRKEDLKMCSEAVFRVLDYLTQWNRAKQSQTNQSHGQASVDAEVQAVTSFLRSSVTAEVIAQRAVECKSFSRALFYWEQHIRNLRAREQSTDDDTNNMLLGRLQDIYTQIDEPDGIEGLSAHLHVLDIDQQILGHRKAGRWTTAQSWYEIKLAEDPDNSEVQMNLLSCLKESGQHDVLLNYIEGMHASSAGAAPLLLPFATEASWATGRWLALEKYTAMAPRGIAEDFNISIGHALLALRAKNVNGFTSIIQSLREQTARSLSEATTPSLGASHDIMFKYHVLTELEMIAGTADHTDRVNVLESLGRRLEVLGAYLKEKQYLLGIRRAAMQLSRLDFTKDDIASAWLTSARLARKGNAIHQSFNAVLHASQLGDKSATIEHARLLWKEGHHRKAIQNLQGAIVSRDFISHNATFQATSLTGSSSKDQQNILNARAHLLLAKWLDSAGQTQSSAVRSQYQLAARTHSAWEKGHYYLGRHYNKLLESEKALAPDQHAESYLTGETAKLVIENYLRSLSYGTKYIYQTLPRILTLWLDLGSQVGQPLDAKYGTIGDFVTRITNTRKDMLAQIHSRFTKYLHKMPAYIFYTALPQIVARIAHPNIEVYKFLVHIIYKVIDAHPQQALWTLLAVSTSMQADRRSRGLEIIQKLRNSSSKKSQPGTIDMKSMIKSGERLAHQLLMVCNAGEFKGNRTSVVSMTKDLSFNKSCIPSPLAVPIESVLTATLPTLTDTVKGHKAFSRDVVTISSFADEVLILSSLQKPRKLTARGSDGRSYGLLCKPKDDLRKDQRLMEFNSMINRSLKRDAESSRRQLYIKTYAVTPLNEECGIIEWVDGLKTLRDILLGFYKLMGIAPNYREIEIFCEEATKSEKHIPFFTDKVLKKFPPVFYMWFVQQFPEPSAWFAARLRYTRSCAVMSMVGTILGLGDRHGENILFEEGNGGTFHVDFNCLFDKGLTFAKPERVPFRLTHNMIDAMGIYGYEGPFRKSSELTLQLLRQQEETLMTILEAFVYDPTLDLLAKKDRKPKKEGAITIPQTGQGVLNSIQRKVRGLLAGESVPLGVEGQVDELIKQATNLTFLAGMYIGWCSFL